MTELMTVGGLAAAVLALAAQAVLKSRVGEAVKDSYKLLKEKVAVWASGEVAMLEAKPTSHGKQLAVAEIIDEQPIDEQNTVRALAKGSMDTLVTSLTTVATQSVSTLAEFTPWGFASARLR